MAQNRPGIAELVTLRWLETSGVDRSANEEEGWAVMKLANVDPGKIDEMIAAEEAIVSRQEALAKALEEADETLVEASDEVKEAAKTLITYLETEGVRQSANGDDERAGGSIARIAMAIAKRLMGQRSEEDTTVEQVLKRLEENWPDFCREVVGVIHGDGTAEAKKEAVSKAVEGLQAKVLETKGE